MVPKSDLGAFWSDFNFCSCVLLVDGAVDGEKNLEKKTREVADIGVYQFSWNFLQRGCDTTMNSLTSLVFFSRLFSPSKVSSTTNSHVLNVVTYVGNMEKKRYGIWSRQFMSNFDITIFSLEWIRM